MTDKERMSQGLPVKTEQKCVPSSPKEFFARLYGHLETKHKEGETDRHVAPIITKHAVPLEIPKEPANGNDREEDDVDHKAGNDRCEESTVGECSPSCSLPSNYDDGESGGGSGGGPRGAQTFDEELTARLFADETRPRTNKQQRASLVTEVAPVLPSMQFPPVPFQRKFDDGPPLFMRPFVATPHASDALHFPAGLTAFCK